MATVNFLYRSTKESANLTLRLLYRNMGKDFTIDGNSKITIEKEFWVRNLNQKKIKDVIILNKQTQYKKLINDLSIHIINKLENLDLSLVNKEWLHYQINDFYNPVELSPKVPVYLTDYFDFYIELLITNRNTKKKLITTKNKLLKYEQQIKKKLFIEEINNIELNNFKNYLIHLKYCTYSN